MIINIVFLILSIIILVKSADYATRYSSRIARSLHFSQFIFSFFIVAVISAFPESAIAIISAIENVPQFGVGTLLGSNVADLTLVFGIITLFSLKGIKVKSKILRKNFFYLILLLFPVILGFNGHFSRLDGILLILGGILFFFTLSFESKMFKKIYNNANGKHLLRDFSLLIFFIALLIISAHFTIRFAMNLSGIINISSTLIGLVFVSLGTCLPELMFSIKAIKNNKEELAFGDILGTVIIDATIILGIVCLINPFSIDTKIIYITGVSMFLGGLLLVSFINTDKMLTKKEGIYLLFFYVIFILVETLANSV